ncbi:hypothetical protein TNCV_621361 [Trichonephila clavipes]|nr:hypothetical protein TNCV_621361 [Trichonephila clavipes]
MRMNGLTRFPHTHSPYLPSSETTARCLVNSLGKRRGLLRKPFSGENSSPDLWSHRPAALAPAAELGGLLSLAFPQTRNLSQWYWARTRDKASHGPIPIPLGYRGHKPVTAVPLRAQRKATNLMRGVNVITIGNQRMVSALFPNTAHGRGDVMVKVMDSWPACQEFEPSTAKDPPCRGSRCTLNISSLERRPVGVVCKLGEGLPAQVSFSSLDHGSKLRGPSPKDLKQLNSVTLIFTRNTA